MIKALSQIEVITLFLEDLPSATAFYQRLFGVEVVYQDGVAAVMKLANVMINLLPVTEAGELGRPATVARPGRGSRALFTIHLDDTNAVCREFGAHGVTLLNGPMDRPWGRRTAAFIDPADNVWEIAQDSPAPPPIGGLAPDDASAS